MSKIRRIDFSPDEFLTGVSNLAHDEIGPYWVACSLMYSQGGPIEDDDLWVAKACGAHVRTWRAIKARLVAKGKLQIEGGFITNRRTLTEIERAQGRVKGARDAAQASVKARRERAENASQSNDYNEIPEATAQISDELTTNYQLPTTKVSKKEDRENLTVTAPASAGADERGEPKSSKAGSRKARAATRGTRIPDGWQPSPDAAAFADNLGLDPKNTPAEFADYWRGVPGTKGEKADWNATYRNRCRALAERKNTNGTQRASHDQPRSNQFRAAAALAAALRGPGGEGRDRNGRDTDRERLAGPDVFDPDGTTRGSA